MSRLKNLYVIVSILLPIVSANLIVFAPSTAPGDIVMDLNTPINGAVPGSLRATFATVSPGTVTLTMQSFGASTEFVNGWGFNIAPSYNFTTDPLTFTFQGSSTGVAATAITTGHEHTEGGAQYKAGFFDIFFQFPATGGGGRFNGGENVVYSIVGNSITEDFFEYMTSSPVSGFGGPYYSAADIKGLPGSLSGSIGVSAIPEPSAPIMFAAVLGIYGVRRRRK